MAIFFIERAILIFANAIIEPFFSRIEQKNALSGYFYKRHPVDYKIFIFLGQPLLTGSRKARPLTVISAAPAFHPLFCFNQFGDLERANLRKGYVHSADDWWSVLQPVVARYRERPLKRFFRGDAAFANPDLYGYLEQENFSYAIRLQSNTILQKHIAPLLTRPVG